MGGRKISLASRVWNTPSLLVGGLMFAVLIGLAVFIPFISPYQPSEQNLSAFLQPPSAEHWLGRINLGATCLQD
ncbi:hypothetical protein RE628_04830 [Paenibacillus sp. D2_2]|uniref:hypothetical protein n=1 Tax=Paenibacillus sp. D2_2 TaxID=3073092 RepID=UPI0028160686|nr:hypothetical protein [Paenibacillus sp. D2_2]WMT41795.1 hypothetical protein RE628_04830 [Paenibacillus sp. D2_2]